MNELENILQDADTINGCLPADRLRSIVERIEHLEEEKKALADDIKEVFSEAKSEGFDVKTIRAVIKLRKIDTTSREFQETLLELYKKALDLS